MIRLLGTYALCLLIVVLPGCAWLQGAPAEQSEGERTYVQQQIDDELDKGTLSPARHAVLTAENDRMAMPNRGEPNGWETLLELGGVVVGLGGATALAGRRAFGRFAARLAAEPSRSGATPEDIAFLQTLRKSQESPTA